MIYYKKYIYIGADFLKLLAIDGNSIINRAFYGIRLLTTKDGKYTNAVYGFINILNRLLESEKPDGVAVAFDLKLIKRAERECRPNLPSNCPL